MVPGRLLDLETPINTLQSLKDAIVGQATYDPHHSEFAHQSIEQLDPQKTPLERTWRGNKAGTIRYQGYPDFKGDKYAERQWVKVSKRMTVKHEFDR